MITPDHAGSHHSLRYHGGRVDQAALRFPAAPLPWLDLSTGINPYPWPAARIPAHDLCALPSVAALERLCATAAGWFGADPATIAALPGSEIGLRAVAGLGLPKPWRIVVPGYRTHAAALPGASAIPAGAIADEAVRGGTILLANPNNPDGDAVSPDALLDYARVLAVRGGMLVIDEAFADALPGRSILPLLRDDDPVLVFRSFGKFFGLAGIRLGFVGGAKAAVAAIAGRLGSWPVSATAIACGTAAYADGDWIAATQALLAGEAAALDDLLRGHGLMARGACPLFRLVESDAAGALFERLGRSGILVRPFDAAPRWLRFGLPGGAAARARLDAALRHR